MAAKPATTSLHLILSGVPAATSVPLLLGRQPVRRAERSRFPPAVRRAPRGPVPPLTAPVERQRHRAPLRRLRNRRARSPAPARPQLEAEERRRRRRPRNVRLLRMQRPAPPGEEGRRPLAPVREPSRVVGEQLEVVGSRDAALRRPGALRPASEPSPEAAAGSRGPASRAVHFDVVVAVIPVVVIAVAPTDDGRRPRHTRMSRNSIAATWPATPRLSTLDGDAGEVLAAPPARRTRDRERGCQTLLSAPGLVSAEASRGSSDRRMLGGSPS